jgi:hypothetical protein
MSVPTMTRGGAAAARMAHNHEVRGSSPLPATKKLMLKLLYFFRSLFYPEEANEKI